ncbi:DEAD/DEAH box helicase [Alteromonas halophila]|uniref:ATP-dependent helicase n=1 Tax=Alteromonas halophila TaxID=516698 RepID=A0A918MW36_9ALTE|nr:DEAD/DEAH box helicase [Alteromonas halophila]GGW75556.1 ATP-dependent helicase [Alteromonas halophila]
MNLRPYQKEAVDALLLFYLQQGTSSGLCVLPTASGKTVIFSEFIRQLVEIKPATRVLILAHTQEIVAQNADKLQRICPQADIGVCCSGLGRKEIKPITSASRDTIYCEISQYPQWDLVIVDEAHLISPDELTRYKMILESIRLFSSDVKVIGFTATPFRTVHGKIYGEEEAAFFSSLIFRKRIDELVNSGYICPVHAVKVNSAGIADTSTVRVTKHDFNATDLERVTVGQKLVENIVTDWLSKTSANMPTVFYASSVAQGEIFEQLLAEQGFHYPLITARTPKQDRKQILNDFDAGLLDGIVNVATLTTGWDAPRLACIVVARPTLSAALFMQIVGRGLRLHKGKTETLLLDYGQNLSRFGVLERVRPVMENRREFWDTEQVAVCPVCDSIVSVYQLDCPFCTELLKSEEDISVCYECSAGNDRNAQFCEVCGEELEENKVLFS